jgi:hypothetical protein
MACPNTYELTSNYTGAVTLTWHQRPLVRLNICRVRCPDCEKLRATLPGPVPSDECPDCGRDVSARWHEVQEG